MGHDATAVGGVIRSASQPPIQLTKPYLLLGTFVPGNPLTPKAPTGIGSPEPGATAWANVELV